MLVDLELKYNKLQCINYVILIPTLLVISNGVCTIV